MSQPNDINPLDYLAIALGWLIPGAGHIALGKWKRGLVFMLTIHMLFAGGLLLAGVRAVNPTDRPNVPSNEKIVGQPIWTYTQLLAGWPTIAVTVMQANKVRSDPLIFAPRIQDVGAVYCGLAGMLNLLVMFDALVRIGGNRRGEEDDVVAEASTQP